MRSGVVKWLAQGKNIYHEKKARPELVSLSLSETLLCHRCYVIFTQMQKIFILHIIRLSIRIHSCLFFDFSAFTPYVICVVSETKIQRVISTFWVWSIPLTWIWGVTRNLPTGIKYPLSSFLLFKNKIILAHLLLRGSLLKSLLI